MTRMKPAAIIPTKEIKTMQVSYPDCGHRMTAVGFSRGM